MIPGDQVRRWRRCASSSWDVERDDAKEALRLAKKPPTRTHYYGLHMPGIEDPTSAWQLKSSSDTRDIPVIFISGDRSEETRQASGSSGGIALL